MRTLKRGISGCLAGLPVCFKNCAALSIMEPKIVLQLGINATTASIVSAQLGLGSGGNPARDGEVDGADLTTGDMNYFKCTYLYFIS